MANDLTTKPIFLDTPGAGVLTSALLYVSKVRWVSKAAVAGDDVVLKDAAGVVKWTSVAAGANTVEESTFIPENEHSWRGLIAAEIDSGQVYLYLA
jgi:hypothetical protein